MAHLIRKQITRYLAPNGKRCPKAAPDAKRVDEKSSKWYGRYRLPGGIVREVALFKDKAASRQRLAELERKAEQSDSGLLDPFEESRKQPLADHVADFRQHLESKGNSGQHVALTVARCEAVFSACGFKLLTQLDADKSSNWLKQRRDEAKAEKQRWDELKAAKQLEKNAPKPKPFGIASSNHHLVAVKGFGNWLVKARRLERNPFAHLSNLNSKVDVRVERRALESEELSRLIEATEQSQKTSRGLTGPDRSALYTLAVMTGLRANELASLTASSFDFQANPPTVTVAADSEKSGRGATLPLHPFAVAKLTTWLKTRPQPSATPKVKPPVESLWPGTWSKRAAEMFRRDLDAARSIWLAEVEKIADEFQHRTKSNFLKPANASGEVADFHALRHTFITMLASSGVHPKVAQQLARHSTITLTMDRYSHTRLVDLNSAVENLPSLAFPKCLSMGSVAVATSTPETPLEADAVQDNPSIRVALRVALASDFSCESVTTADETLSRLTLAHETQTPLQNKGFANGCEPLMTDEETTPGRSRTYDLRIRNPLLYPAELRARKSLD